LKPSIFIQENQFVHIWLASSENTLNHAVPGNTEQTIISDKFLKEWREEIADQ
jgi:hypothetical protein